MDDTAPNFEIWLFRRGDADLVFDIKFQVRVGRGLFRTPHTSGVTSTPAGTSGEVRGLDGGELIQTSFIHVHESRTHLTFSADASPAFDTIPLGEWVAVVVGDSGHLTIAAGPAGISNAAATPLATQRPKRTGVSGERKSAADHILDLEDQLARSRRHIAALKERVTQLEDQVERLGGDLTPLLLDIGAGNGKIEG